MLTGAWATANRVQIGERQYQALLLDPLEIAEPELIERIAALAEAGIPVLALGPLPRRAPGLRDAEARDARVRAAAKQLAAKVVRVPNPDALEALLAKHVAGGLVEPAPGTRLTASLERRRSPAGDILLVFNESWSPDSAGLRFKRAGARLTLWDPRSGSRTLLRERVAVGDVVSLELEPAETLILTLGSVPEETVLNAHP